MRSKAWTVFARSNTGVVSSNPTRLMDVCPTFFCVCVVLCRYRPCDGANPSSKGSYRLSIRSTVPEKL
jgi:hypothetical protein